MKALFMIFVMSACVYIGNDFAKKLKRKERLFEDLKIFCWRLKNSIGFFNEKLLNVFEKSQSECGSDFSDICKNCVSSLNNTEDKLLKKENFAKNFLTDEEKDAILGFFSCLGKSDSASQLKQIEGYEKIFEQKNEEYRKNANEKGGLYKRLGIFAGLFLIVLCL